MTDLTAEEKKIILNLISQVSVKVGQSKQLLILEGIVEKLNGELFESK